MSGASGERRPDASMTLLTTMLERPLDPGYQEAADRRAAAGLAPATTTRTLLAVVMAVLTGFLFAVGAQALRPKPTAIAAIRGELVQQIESLQDQGSVAESKIAELTKQVSDYEALRLRQAGSEDLTATIDALAIQAGAVAMTGPGLTLTIDDAASLDTDANAGVRPSGGFEAGRVTSGDLQIVVNGLWGAGAEAISINGHRLTSTAAIRFAGQAIIVGFRPLTRPYVITALGNPTSMRSLFEPSFAGVYLGQLTEEYAIRANLATGDKLTVPGDSSTRLSIAKPLRPTVGSSGSPSVTSSLKSTTTTDGGGKP